MSEDKGIFVADIGDAEDIEPEDAAERVGALEESDTGKETSEPVKPVEAPSRASGSSLFDPPPKTAHEKVVAAYLEANASEPLKEKIREARKSGKGIAACYAYITEEARKQAVNGSAMIADEVVYGWAVHYFEDEWRDEIEREKKAEAERAANAERWKREAEERRAKAAQTEAERVAAMSDEEREAYEREQARRKAEAEEAAAKRAQKEAQRKAKEERKRRAEELEKAQMTLF